MYAFEITDEFGAVAAPLHPKRFKLIHLRIFALMQNPRPPDAELLEVNTYRVRVGPTASLMKLTTHNVGCGCFC